MSWVYVNVDDRVRNWRDEGRAERYDATEAIYDQQTKYAKSLGLIDAEDRLYEVEMDLDTASEQRDAFRERYRTTLDEGDPDPRLKRRYLTAEARVDALRADQKLLTTQQREMQKKLRVYKRAHRAEARRADQRLESYKAATDRLILILRLLMALATLGLSVWLLRWVTERSPRAQPLAQAGVIAGGLMLLTLIVDYGDISFDFDSVGPLGIALLGIVLTVGAFFGLQRYLRNRRPNRRLRANECVECGYPGGTSSFCESCGAQLRTTCESCGQTRRVGVEHCGACGVA